MTVNNTAKEVVRIATTAGLSKDVVDLMEKKLALLTEELALAQQKNAQLEIENRQLKTQVQNTQPSARGFHEYRGALWKRTATGFEPNPYCKECPSHPVMLPIPPGSIDPSFWSCSNAHTVPNSGRPTV